MGDIAGDIRVNCQWSDVKGHKGTELKMPGPHSQCASGYSRVYDYGCNNYCGCTNKDGSPKVECDYCCSESSGTCHRQQGPRTSSMVSNLTEPSPGSLPKPGHLARQFLPHRETADHDIIV